MTLLNLNFSALKVLVVDDSGTVRAYLRKVLLELGVHTIQMAEDGADAIEKLAKFPADVAICDLHMAPLDGIEFTRLLRNADDSPNTYLPVLMLTADATELQLKNALAAGVNGFMIKPIDMCALRRSIVALFSRPQVFVQGERTLRPVLQKWAIMGPAEAAPREKPAGVQETRRKLTDWERQFQ